MSALNAMNIAIEAAERKRDAARTALQERQRAQQAVEGGQYRVLRDHGDVALAVVARAQDLAHLALGRLDGVAAAREAIEKRGLADVRTAHDCYETHTLFLFLAKIRKEKRIQ